MKFTDRIYYPLNEVAKKLGCTREDLIHHAAIGGIEICALIDEHIEHKKNYFKIHFPYEEESKLQLYEAIKSNFITHSECAYEISHHTLTMGFMTKNKTRETSKIEDFELFRVDGLVAIGPLSFLWHEAGGYKDLEVCNFDAPLNSIYHGVSFLFDPIPIPPSNLFMTAEEVNSLLYVEDGSDGVRTQHQNTSKQSKLIKALLEVHYGKGASNNINALINEERGTGELLKDLQLRGIKPPVTRKALKGWMEGVELDYVGIPTPGVEKTKK